MDIFPAEVNRKKEAHQQIPDQHFSALLPRKGKNSKLGCRSFMAFSKKMNLKKTKSPTPGFGPTQRSRDSPSI